MIAATDRDKITESFVEAFEKNYTGKYEAIEGAYPKSSKYPIDANQYVFVMKTHENPGYWVGKERFPPTTDYQFGLLDRKKGKYYYQDFYSGNYKKGSRNFVKHLEEWRKANAGK